MIARACLILLAAGSLVLSLLALWRGELALAWLAAGVCVVCLAAG